jgi:hypothetical protein
MTIFIPVLWVCVALNCQFMQSSVYFKNEEQCQKSIEDQKIHMLKLSRGTITQIEGTCISTKLKEERWI